MLLKKTLAAKKKALILCPMPAASALDDALWSHDAGSWIAHGLDDADGADHCHVWISTDMAANPIKAEFLFLLHGSVPTTWDGIARSFYLFDGRSDAQLQQARDQWKEWQISATVNWAIFPKMPKADGTRWPKGGSVCRWLAVFLPCN